MSLNRVTIMGRLTASPELKTTPRGVEVTSFSIAVERNYAKQGEEKQADFINVVAWRNTASFICKYFSKGSMIAIDGSLQTRSYTANDGSTRYVTEVLAERAFFTGEKRQDSTNTYQTNSTPDIVVDDIPDDADLPF